jgi:hypothetical protein
MGTRHTPTGGRGEGGEVGGRVAYMYMLPENSRPGIVVARRKAARPRNTLQLDGPGMFRYAVSIT